MTDIYLIRHGQAAFGSDDYDRLSEMGRQQAQVLGEHCRQIALNPDALWSGEMLRQRDTALLAFPNMAAPTIAANFNEYDAQGLLTRYVGSLEDLGVAGADQIHQLARNPIVFQTALDRVLQQWFVDRSASDDRFENWQDFTRRVEMGLDKAIEHAGKQDKVVIATSAGAIALIMSRVLNMGQAGFMAFNRRIYNASVTHLVYGKKGYALQGFNDVAAQQLSESSEVTFR